MADESTPSSPTPETPPPRTTGGNFRWEPPTAEELQALMPGYTIEKILGRGGMGAVYRGVQTNLDRPVAIKILPPGVEKEDPSFAERFKSEARLMARLSHPAVVAVYDFGTNAGGQLYFAMEYVDGSDVSQMIAAQGKLPPEHALAITAHVCDALSAAHELGIVHRDIKPANVLLNMKGQVKVADFGLAKVEDPGQHGLTKTGYAMGTPDFVAPEALTLGTAIDGRADLYAVGVMLYQMLTGNIPRGAFKPVSVLVPGLDPRYDPIILKAMQHDREERHQSAAELRRELDVILTVPFVRNDAPVSAAIPVAQMAQAPGQRSAAQKPQPRSAGAPTRQPSVKAGEGTRAPETPSKSKTPLFIGLGVAAAIGIGAFVMMGGKKEAKQSGPLNRSAAEIASQGLPEGRAERGNPLSGTSVPQTTKPAQGTVRTTLSTPEPPKPATPVPSSPTPQVSKSSAPKFPPGQWVKMFTKLEDLPPALRSRQSSELKDGWIKAEASGERLHLPPQFTGNYAMRASFRRRADNFHASYLNLRVHGSDNQRYQLFLSYSGFLSLQSLQNGKFSALTLVQSQQELKPGETFQLSLGIVGSRLVTRLGSELLQSHVDATHASGNGFILLQDDVRDIEVINLDGLSEAEALKILGVDEKGNDLRKPAAVAASSPAPTVSKSPPLPVSQSSTAPASTSPSLPVSKSSPAFPPGQWVKLFTKFEDLPEELRNPSSGVKFVEGDITLSKGSYLSCGKMWVGKNIGIRANFLDLGNFEMRVRTQASSGNSYFGWSGNDLIRGQGAGSSFVSKTLKKMDFPISSSAQGRLEFAVVGNRLVARNDDKVVMHVSDDQVGPGSAAIANYIGALRDIEVINLDGLPEAEALRILGVDEKGNDLRALAAKQEQLKIEQAKAADAMAAIPELKTLHEQFVKLQAERVTAPFEAEVAKLNAGYVGGIDREIANEKKAGHLDGVIALEAEKKLIADKQPIPAEDEATTTDALKKLRGIYRAAYAKIEAARAENLKALTDPLDARLKQIEATLTQQDRISHAKTVREYREGLGKDGSAVTPDRNTTNGGAAAKMNEAEKSLRAPLKKFPPGDDRKAAEWVLDMGGSVNIRDANGDQIIQAKGSLPKRPFDLVSIGLAAPERAKRQVIEYSGLLPLAGLRKLTSVALSSLPVTDEDTEILASLPELRGLQLSHAKGFTGKKLALLKDSTKITGMNLGGIGLTPEGIGQIAQFTNLTSLQLNDTDVGDSDLAPLRSLKKLNSLNLRNTKVTQEGWKQLKGLRLTELAGAFTRGTAREWCAAMAAIFPDVNKLEFSAPEAVPTEDVAAAAVFPELRTLILTTSFMDDAAVGALAGLTRLETLLLRAGTAGPVKSVTDASMDSLLALKELQKLRLEKIDSLTPAALTTLTKLKSLRTLEIVNCPQLDDATVTAFKKERPDVTVTR